MKLIGLRLLRKRWRDKLPWRYLLPIRHALLERVVAGRSLAEFRYRYIPEVSRRNRLANPPSACRPADLRASRTAELSHSPIQRGRRPRLRPDSVSRVDRR